MELITAALADLGTILINSTPTAPTTPNPFQAVLDRLNAAVGGMAIPAAGIGITLFVVGMLLMPILPDWAASMKGYLMRSLLLLLFLGMAPGLIRVLSDWGRQAAPAPTTALVLMPLLTTYVFAAIDGYDRWARRKLGRPMAAAPSSLVARPTELWGA